jgi:hypothetical protein
VNGDIQENPAPDFTARTFDLAVSNDPLKICAALKGIPRKGDEGIVEYDHAASPALYALNTLLARRDIHRGQRAQINPGRSNERPVSLG